jgi:hypothetical protein
MAARSRSRFLSSLSSVSVFGMGMQRERMPMDFQLQIPYLEIGALTGRGENMLWTIVAVLLILWLLGFSLSIGGGLIHILLIVALVVIVINLLSGRRSVI